MPSPDIVQALGACMLSALLLMLTGAVLKRVPTVSPASGHILQAVGALLTVLALGWPVHLGDAGGSLARLDWLPDRHDYLAQVPFAVGAVGAAAAWRSGRRARAGVVALLMLPLAWMQLEPAPSGSPAIAATWPMILSAPLLGAIMLPLALNGKSLGASVARGAGALLAAALITAANWDFAQGRYGVRSTASDWLPMVALAIFATVMPALLREVGASRVPTPRRSQPNRDGLTGLPQRVQFEMRLFKAVRRAKKAGHRVAVFLIHLDDLATVNETHGFTAGDLVLKHAAARLRRLARKDDDALARLSGNDFLLFVPAIANAEVADTIGLRVVEALKRPCRSGDAEIPVSASVGISLWPDVLQPSRLIGCAELATREARRAGGGCHRVYRPETESVEMAEAADLVSDLRRAISQNQLHLHFQPKIDARSGKVASVEALLRWRHPQRGLIPPVEFVPLAERNGLIGAIGDWVIDEACRQSRAWREAGLRMRLAINISPLQMQQPELPGRIREALNRYAIHPSLLTCEITESAAMQDTRMTHETFRQLGEMGVHVSIDDFGTGYSSLAYLRRLPAEELKIDRAFVTDLSHSADARAIVDAVVKLGHALGLKVVAEGVETSRQHDILVQLGCDELQGYLFARPMSASALLIWALSDQAASEAFCSSLFSNTKDMAASTALSRRHRRAMAEAARGPGSCDFNGLKPDAADATPAEPAAGLLHVLPAAETPVQPQATAEKPASFPAHLQLVNWTHSTPQ